MTMPGSGNYQRQVQHSIDAARNAAYAGQRRSRARRGPRGPVGVVRRLFGVVFTLVFVVVFIAIAVGIVLAIVNSA